jgi:hypothetical protein
MCRAELDSHADTCAVNHVACIIAYHGKVAEVSGFSSSLNTIEYIPIVKVVVAYDDFVMGETTILVFNQALYFEDCLPNILLNPNQMRMHGIIIDD